MRKGNAAGLGETRKKELIKSGMTLGLRDEDDVFVVDNPYEPLNVTPLSINANPAQRRLSRFHDRDLGRRKNLPPPHERLRPQSPQAKVHRETRRQH